MRDALGYLSRAFAAASLMIGGPGLAYAVDTTPPTVEFDFILTGVFDPACSPLATSLSVSDDVGVTSLTWQNNWGDHGVLSPGAGGISFPGLREGTSLFTLTARDAAGNSGSTALQVGYRAVTQRQPAFTVAGVVLDTQRPGVALAGDINADGLSDVLIKVAAGISVYLGSATGPVFDKTLPARSDSAMASAGDVNGDGYDDVIIGSTGLLSGDSFGVAEVYLGSASGLSSGPAWVTFGERPGTYYTYGAWVAGAGDVNRDGFDDILVVDPLLQDALDPYLYLGRAYLYLGSSAGPATTPAWTSEGLGTYRQMWTARSAGDVNGDGYSDVVVTMNSGYIRIYHGSAAGLPGVPSWSANTSQDPDYVITAEGAGDVNGDGYDDLVVGCPFCDLGAHWGGAALVYLGSASGMAGQPAWSVGSVLRYFDGNFGRLAAPAGDIDGDGYADILMTESGTLCDGIPRVHVYRGSSQGIEPQPFLSIPGGVQWAAIGAAGAADVNGDGLDDLLISHDGPPAVREAAFYLGDRDIDRDGYSAAEDCTESDGQVWSAPGVVGELAFGASGAGGASGSELSWPAPMPLGGALSITRYDVVRSPAPDGLWLGGPVVCVEADAGPDRLATDGDVPPPGGAFYYAVRSRNACGSGAIATNSSGVSYAGPECP